MNEQLKKRLQARKKEMTDAKEIEINETHEQNQEKFEQELALRVVLYLSIVLTFFNMVASLKHQVAEIHQRLC